MSAAPDPPRVVGPQAPAHLPVLLAPEHLVNRELALLEFNRRVLEQATDPEIPLLERLRFLTICSTNLDEFFEIRVAGLKQQVAHGAPRAGPDGLGPGQALAAVSRAAHALVADQYAVLNEQLMPALEKENVRLIKRAGWTPQQRRWVRDTFRNQVLPVLTPMALDPAHPFPRVLNKGLNFIVRVAGADAFGRKSGTAVLQVPRSLPRVLAFPARVAQGPHDFVLLSSIVHEHVGELFPGMELVGCHQFRVTRDSDLWVDEEEVDNLLQAVQGELSTRNYATAVRLEVSESCPADVAQSLLGHAGLGPDDLYVVNGPVNLHRMAALWETVPRTDLRYAPFVPGVPPTLVRDHDSFASIRRRDVLLHHPFQSFSPVVDLVRQAARDPNVVALKQTLYRTDPNSDVIEALVEAASAGKEVTAIIELRARFDEAANIRLATRLQEVGANVVYGVVGYKAHVKMLMVVRMEDGKARRYVHLGTGNYHAGTARAYTDLGLLSCDAQLGDDVHALFLQLTGLGRSKKLKKLYQSPFTLFKGVLRHVEAEAAHARAGRPARIIAKMNALSDPAIIRALYEASRAGVPIDLIVRGACCLRPGVPGVSESIRVRSIVGRFLEHDRVFYFLAGGEERVFAASADWMTRNLFHRVEACFPIDDPVLKRRIIEDCLENYLADNCEARVMQPDGTYRRQRPEPGAPKHSAQENLLARLAD